MSSSSSLDCVVFSILINPTLTNTTTPDSLSNTSSRLSLRFSSGGSSSSGSANNYNTNQRASTSQGSLREFSLSKSKPLESQLEWINWLRKAFLDFVEKKVHKSMETELKILFLEHFMNPLTEKVAWKTRADILLMLNLFCEVVLEWMVPFEWIEIEKTKDGKNLNYYTQQLSMILDKNNLFEHEYLKDFIHKQANLTISTSTQEEIEESETVDEVKLICSMFFLEVADLFNEFEFTNRKKIGKWFAKGLNSDIIPKYVIKIYKMKRERLNKVNEEYIFKGDDLNQKHVIASDWNYTNFIGREHSTEWTLTYSRCPETSMWISSVDRSSDKLGLKTLKVVGYLDISVAKITKSTFSDSHFHQFFKEATFHDYSSIDKSHSQKKYPLVFMSNTFKFGPIFSMRELHLVYTTIAKFQSNMMVESCILFKSRDYVHSLNVENKKLIKVPMIGARMYYMVDKNRVRYVEYRTLNSGGLLNSNLVLYNKMAAKKTVDDILSAIEKSQAESLTNKNGNNPDNDNLSRLLHNYCEEYCNINLENIEIL